MIIDKLLGAVKDSSSLPDNRVTDSGVQNFANIMQEVPDKLSVLDYSVNPILDTNYIKRFRKRYGSVIILRLHCKIFDFAMHGNQLPCGGFAAEAAVHTALAKP